MATRPPPSNTSDVADDPLLPFALAARAGDEGAERELLVRVTPVVLEVVRRARGPGAPEVRALALDALVGCLRALPGFRGDEPVSRLAARIALERSRHPGLSFSLSDDALLALGEARASVRGGTDEPSLIASLVDKALENDAAVMVSHIALRPAPAARRLKRRYWALATLALVLAGALGYLAARGARSLKHSQTPRLQELPLGKR